MTDLFKIGIACVIAAVVGGGLSIFGVQLPIVSSIRRQAILFFLGIALIVAWHQSQTEEAMRTFGFPYLANSTFTMTHAVDNKGGDWSGSIIKFTSQSLDIRRSKLAVEGFIKFIQNPLEETNIDGEVGFRGVYLPSQRSLSLASTNDDVCRSSSFDPDSCSVSEGWVKTHGLSCLGDPQSFFALLSPDETRLTQGTWTRPLYQSCIATPGRWEASR